MEDLIYKGPEDGDGNYPGIHLTCADGGDPNAASEIVIHAQPGHAFFEFYFGPGFLGQRQYLMALAPGQEERLRAFCAKWLLPAPPPESKGLDLPDPETLERMEAAAGAMRFYLRIERDRPMDAEIAKQYAHRTYSLLVRRLRAGAEGGDVGSDAK